MFANRKDKGFFDFACSCGDESFEKWEQVYEDVKAELEANDKNFTERVIFGLDMFDNGSANIEHIYTDMWSGIAVKYQYDYKEKLECEDEEGNQVEECKCDKDHNYDCEYSTQHFWIECDRIHHGLARAYQLVKEFDESRE